MAAEAAQWRAKPILPCRQRCCLPPARYSAAGSRRAESMPHGRRHTFCRHAPLRQPPCPLA
eukprot:10200659-Alexandrium_andersonii.AAC.1